MITLYKNCHFCELSINQDLFGVWEVTKKSGCSTRTSVYVDTYKFADELDAKLKLFDLEVNKRKLGFKYRD